MRFALILASTAALAVSTSASAATVLNDGFEGDATGTAITVLNNFTVSGTVDVVGASNPFGIVAPSNVVDLDGTPGPGMLSTASFAFGAGDFVQLSFVLGGAQRGSVVDQFSAGFSFGGVTLLQNYTLGGAYGSVNLGTFSTNAFSSSTGIAGNSPFATYTLSFTAGNAGTLMANIGTTSADNVGPLLDSVRLDIGVVPEPASWALMIAGFGMVGFAARRRRSALAAA